MAALGLLLLFLAVVSNLTGIIWTVFNILNKLDHPEVTWLSTGQPLLLIPLAVVFWFVGIILIHVSD